LEYGSVIAADFEFADVGTELADYYAIARAYLFHAMARRKMRQTLPHFQVPNYDSGCGTAPSYSDGAVPLSALARDKISKNRLK
jgi:hypothetical protein